MNIILYTYHKYVTNQLTWKYNEKMSEKTSETEQRNPRAVGVILPVEAILLVVGYAH